MDQQALQEFITLFLKINPQPSDQQFHALAEAAGVDKETLESIAYSMLSEAEDLLEDPAELASAPSTAIPNEDPLDVVEASSPSTSLSYGDDGEAGGSTHCENEECEPEIPIALNAAYRLMVMADSQEVMDDPTMDPDEMSLQEVGLNDGDPTDDDLGLQQETLDDGTDANDTGMGTNTVSDVLTDDGVPDTSLN